MSDFSSPLRRARGLGSAQDGTHHWWIQRVTAIALVPLVIWFIMLVVSLGGASYDAATATLSQPLNGILMILLVTGTFYHASLGFQVVLEDYVSHEWGRKLSIIAVNLFCIAGAVACYYSILKIGLGGS
ncbi:MAG: succinate dehydrogenase, hydrophobic membrane anchor protein [Pseudomonadota bacterium]